MKKVVLAALIALVAGCTSETSQPGASASVSSSSLEGSYFDKKQRITITLKKKDESTYLMDTKTLAGESVGQPVKKMTEAQISEFFKDAETKPKAGQYFMTEEMCSSVVIKYENDDDVYLANCMIPTLNHYVKK